MESMAKSSISQEEVLHVAQLSKLNLKKDEVEKFKDQLSNIFDFVNQIGELKTEGVDETSYSTGASNVFREDVVDESRVLNQEKALSNAKSTHQGFFTVEAIFEEN